jgi:hypothetical protein
MREALKFVLQVSARQHEHGYSTETTIDGGSPWGLSGTAEMKGGSDGDAETRIRLHGFPDNLSNGEAASVHDDELCLWWSSEWVQKRSLDRKKGWVR